MVLRGVHGMLERVLHITGTGVLFTVAGRDLEHGVTGGADRADGLG